MTCPREAMPGDTDEMGDEKKEKAWEGLPGEIQKLGTALINRDRRASSSARIRREWQWQAGKDRTIVGRTGCLGPFSCLRTHKEGH